MRGSVPKLAKTKPSLIVIGNGMVGAKFCEKIVGQKLHLSHRVTVFGAEPRPAYDRIRLATIAASEDPTRLELLPRSWYADHDITLHTGTPVTKITRGNQEVITTGGQHFPYDTLVLATGSSPFVPDIRGADTTPGVFVYRTIEDISAIREHARRHATKSAAVIGGGLLGLEAAQTLQHLGIADVHLIQLGRFLMSAQLNAGASKVLENNVEAQEIRLHLERKTRSLHPLPGGSIELAFEDDPEPPLTIGLVIIATGIRANAELASEAGIDCVPGGGIRVDDGLQTSEPGIYAIGECAQHRNERYGLAAPGYQMAEVLADRLAGRKRARFLGGDRSTRLKMLGIDVVTIGDPLQPGLTIEHAHEGVYRLVVLDGKDRMIGALGVGPWDEAGLVQMAVAQAKKIPASARQRFADDGRLWDGTPSPVSAWPDAAVVCNCMRVTKGTLCAALVDGAADPDRLAAATGASTVCGSCKPLLAALAGAPAPLATGGYRALAAVSVAALACAVLALVIAPPPVGDSVLSLWYKIGELWRDPFFKQVSGFSLLGIVLGGLLLSLRKRFRWFRFGTFARWRVLHTAFGLLSLAALFVHTGFRFGHNLNFWLMLTFVLLSLVGALAGIVAALENKGLSRAAIVARRFRPALNWAHLVLFWPLPILLTFHILSAYLY